MQPTIEVTVNETRLENGLIVVTEEIPTAASAAVGIFVGAGSRDEIAGEVGASHFLEHLTFKGTKDRDARSISLAFDRMGGDSNAYTTKEYTTFHARVLGEHLAEASEILADIVERPAIRAEDFEVERGIIADELALNVDDPDELCADELYLALFPDHQLGASILGTKAQIEAMERQAVLDFHEGHYLAANTVVSIAGCCSHEEAVAWASASLGSRPGVHSSSRLAPGNETEALRCVERDAESVHVFVAYRAPARSGEGRFAAVVLNQLFGAGMSSRLFQIIREDHGWAYSVGSSYHGYTDTGLLTAGFAAPLEHAREAMAVVGESLRDLASQGPSDEELDVACGSLRAELLMAAEDAAWRMARNARGFLLDGLVRPLELDLSAIEAVTGEDVRMMAEQLLHAPKSVSCVGPLADGGLEILGALG